MSSSNVMLSVAHDHAQSFTNGSIKSPWEYFEYSVKLVLARWTALRMAMEGEWGGGDSRRKYEILIDEILHVFKYHKTVYADDMAMNISEYVESEFGLICEDGSVEEVSELLVLLAEECKRGQYDRVRALHEQVQSMIPIDLKRAKVRQEEQAQAAQAAQADGGEQEQVEEEPLVDADGFVTVRRSSRRRAAPKVYDPSAQFPGAQ